MNVPITLNCYDEKEVNGKIERFRTGVTVGFVSEENYNKFFADRKYFRPLLQAAIFYGEGYWLDLEVRSDYKFLRSYISEKSGSNNHFDFAEKSAPYLNDLIEQVTNSCDLDLLALEQKASYQPEVGFRFCAYSKKIQELAIGYYGYKKTLSRMLPSILLSEADKRQYLDVQQLPTDTDYLLENIYADYAKQKRIEFLSPYEKGIAARKFFETAVINSFSHYPYTLGQVKGNLLLGEFDKLLKAIIKE